MCLLSLGHLYLVFCCAFNVHLTVSLHHGGRVMIHFETKTSPHTFSYSFYYKVQTQIFVKAHGTCD